MAWTYKPDPRGKEYAKHTPKAINSVLADYRRGRLCLFDHALESMEFQ